MELWSKKTQKTVYLPNNNVMYSQTAWGLNRPEESHSSTVWVTDQPVILLINTNTTWNRGGFPYLRDKQQGDKHFLRNQNTINDVTRKSIVCPPLSVYMFLIYWVTDLILFLSTLAHLLPECVLAYFCLCASVSVCVGLQWLCSCRLFLGGVCFRRCSIFLLLCQSHDCMGCYNWLGEEQERKER